MNKFQISFTVVIPTYNHADFLFNALQSVLNQTYQNFEVIVIDNNSEDNTVEVVSNFNDSRIKLHKINNNGVIASSRNLGIEKASNEWIAFLDSDDIWYPNKLSKVKKCLQKNNSYDVLSTNEYKVYQDSSRKKILSYGPLYKDSYKHLLIYGNRLSPSATVVRKSFLQKNSIKFNENIDFITVEDYDFWLQLAFHKANFKFIHSVQGEYLVHGFNNSSREQIHKKNEIYLLEHHIFDFQKFTNNKIKLKKRIDCRLKLHKSIYDLRKIKILSFIIDFSKVIIKYPLQSSTYLFERLYSKFYNKVSSILFGLKAYNKD